MKKYELPELMLGDVFSSKGRDGKVERWRVVGFEDDGTPIIEAIE